MDYLDERLICFVNAALKCSFEPRCQVRGDAGATPDRSTACAGLTVAGQRSAKKFRVIPASEELCPAEVDSNTNQLGRAGRLEIFDTEKCVRTIRYRKIEAPDRCESEGGGDQGTA